ncbi:MAG: GAF domain-containing protein [Hymenobacteraceae bacterium]|nr:GAF domain-containing protein [Hymenobacteraceae bacterium]
MAETLLLDAAQPRTAVYRQLLPQLRALVESEPDSIANAANLMAGLRQALGFFWVGIYYVRRSGTGNSEELVLGPFQGPIACTRIRHGRGVCGAAWAEARTIVVPDVEAFPGHIACSSESKSEIVVPVFSADGRVVAVLDVDSDHLNDFSAEVDQAPLEEVATLLARYGVATAWHP